MRSVCFARGQHRGNNCTFDWLCRPRIEPTDNERLFVMMAEVQGKISVSEVINLRFSNGAL